VISPGRLARSASVGLLASLCAAAPSAADPPRVRSSESPRVRSSESPRVRSSESPHVLYMLHCQGCHRPDGTGLPGAVPSLEGSVARFLSVPGGRAFLVQVPGSATAPLSDAELAAVLNWMVRRFGPDAEAAAAAPYAADEVGRLRGAPLVDVAATRRALVAAMGEGAPPAVGESP
jgi:mono/diheme cytochrome c family protein